MNSITSRQAAYRWYLCSDQWRKTRAHVLNTREMACERCGAKQNLEVHHLSYERIGNELDSDLTLLCRKCHGSTHGYNQRHRKGDDPSLLAAFTPEHIAKKLNVVPLCDKCGASPFECSLSIYEDPEDDSNILILCDLCAGESS